MAIVKGNIPINIKTNKVKNINIINSNVIIVYLNILANIKNNPFYILFFL
jgi:hypothetical protein